MSILKWALACAFIGCAFAIYDGGGTDDIIMFSTMGGIGGVALRKWLFRTFWM